MPDLLGDIRRHQFEQAVVVDDLQRTVGDQSLCLLIDENPFDLALVFKVEGTVIVAFLARVAIVADQLTCLCIDLALTRDLIALRVQLPIFGGFLGLQARYLGIDLGTLRLGFLAWLLLALVLML